MNIRKNLAAKLASLVASIAALGGIWGIVHTNPPPASANADGTAPSDAQPAQNPTPAAGTRQRVAQSAPTTRRRNTRTRVS